MAKRKSVPKEAVTEVLVHSLRRCCLCYGLDRDLAVKQGQIAHLDRDPANNGLDNLVYLCLDHHAQYDTRTSQSKGFTIGEVKSHRNRLYRVLEIVATDTPDKVREVERYYRTLPGQTREDQVREEQYWQTRLDENIEAIVEGHQEEIVRYEDDIDRLGREQDDLLTNFRRHRRLTCALFRLFRRYVPEPDWAMVWERLQSYDDLLDDLGLKDTGSTESEGQRRQL